MKQRGFTLIELVVVIVILGILAATALPKFVDLGGDARGSVMKGVEGSAKSANTVLYAKAAVAKQLGATGSVTIDGVTVDTVYGFAKDATELKKMLDLSSEIALDAGTPPTFLQHSGATTPANCSVTYTPAVLVVGPPATITPPIYTLDVTGC